MNRVTRRDFLKRSGIGLGLASASVAGLGACASGVKGDFMPKTTRRVVVIGGGWGGATAAKYVRLEDPAIEVVMLEPNRQFISCPFSNLVLSGLRTMESITLKYDGLARHGVKIIHDSASAIEADGKRVAVLGRMLELGAESERGHREVGESAATLGIDHLISIADDTIAVAAEKAGLENSAVAKDASEAAEMLSEIVGPGDLVLVKGSRSSRTELVLDEFAKLQPVGNIR